MNRRHFLRLLASLTAAGMVRLRDYSQKTAARSNTMAVLKGIHITTGGNVSAINQLGANWWCGTDEVFRAIRDPNQNAQFANLTGTYVFRIPNDASVGEIQAVQALDTPENAFRFNNEFIVLNEPDLWNKTPAQAAALATTAIQNILTACPSGSKIMLCAGSQLAGTAYVQQVLTLLSPTIRTTLDGLAWHYYPQVDPTPTGGIWDESRLRNFLTTVCAFTVQQGFTKAWLTEFGWGADADPWRVSKELPKFWAVMNEFSVLKRGNYYCANGDNMNLLVNGAGLTWAGEAYKNLT